MEESEWRLEPEGEAEVPEIIIVSVRWKAHSWTWMAKAAASKKQSFEEREAPSEEGEEI